ncbi:hypothetical protein G6F56_014316 [Rhizopus delemar]|nr:hypothetical protein G6F56_014316 [Rhizopus delemar]
MSQSARFTAIGNGIPIVQPASSTPTPRPNVRRVAPAAATQLTASLAEHEALKRRLDATEAMVNALVAGSQQRTLRRKVDSEYTVVTSHLQ